MFANIKRHGDWTQKDYFAYPALSNSDLKLMIDSPRKLRAKLDGDLPFTVTEPMALGSAYDDYVLSPHLFNERWDVVDVGDMPTTDNQKEFCRLIVAGFEPDEAIGEAYKKAPMTGEQMYALYSGWIRMMAGGSDMISDASMHTIRTMHANLERHEHAMRVIEDSDHQVCFTGIHEETGVEVKGMLDMLSKDGVYETDLKVTSTQRAKINGWWIKDRMYDTQRAMYGALSGARRSGFLVCESIAPHESYLIDYTDHMEYAYNRLNNLIVEYDWRQKNGFWERSMEYHTNGGWETIR
jgi:hypothetical protein